MATWAITVTSPPSRLGLENALQQFAQALPDRPPQRAGNVLGYELFIGSTEPGQYGLLLITVDHGATSALAALVGELDEHLPEGFEVSGVELSVVEKSAAASH